MLINVNICPTMKSEFYSWNICKRQQKLNILFEYMWDFFDIYILRIINYENESMIWI